jgi:TPR repeat protein
VSRLKNADQAGAQDLQWTESSKVTKEWYTKKRCFGGDYSDMPLIIPLCVVINGIVDPFRGWSKEKSSELTGSMVINLKSPAGLALTGLRVNEATLGNDSQYRFSIARRPEWDSEETELGIMSIEPGWKEKYEAGEEVSVPTPYVIRYIARRNGKDIVVMAITEPEGKQLRNPFEVVIETKKTFSADARKRIAEELAAKKAQDMAENARLEEAFKKSRKAAEQGDSSAQLELAQKYLSGDGVEKNSEEAAKWFLKAASQGNVEAQVSLGWLYRRGDGVRKSDSEAIKWFQKAAGKGSSSAEQILEELEGSDEIREKNNLALKKKYGSRVTRVAKMQLSDRVGNPTIDLMLKISIAIESRDISGELTMVNLQRDRPQNMNLYKPFIAYKKNGQFALGYIDEETLEYPALKPGEKKIRKLNFANRWIWGDMSGRTFDTETEKVLLSRKQDLIRAFLEGSRDVSVSISPNKCKDCEIYFDFPSN